MTKLKVFNKTKEEESEVYLKLEQCPFSGCRDIDLIVCDKKGNKIQVIMCISEKGITLSNLNIPIGISTTTGGCKVKILNP